MLLGRAKRSRITKSALGVSVLTVLTVIACGGSLTDPSDAGTHADGSTNADGSVDADNLTGAYSCDASTCSSGEYCVHPCSGGVIPDCIPATDAGACPANTVHAAYCRSDSGMPTQGCVQAPPPAYCSAVPKCPMGDGGRKKGRDVECMCA